MEWLLSLWGKNKALFCILLPLVVIAFVSKLVLDSNYQGAIDTVNDAQNADNELAQQQAAANAVANTHNNNANAIEDKIDTINGDEGWHKKH